MIKKLCLITCIWTLLFSALLTLTAYSEAVGSTGFTSVENPSYTYLINSDNTITLTSFDWSAHTDGADIIIPATLDNHTVISIGSRCYTRSRNHTIGTLVIPNSVQHISAHAFMELEINHISIPASVRIIEQGAFVCEFKSIAVAKGCKNYTAINGALYEKPTKTLLATAHNGTAILDGITTIGSYACYAIKPDAYENAVIPQSVTTINAYAYLNADLPTSTSRSFHIPATTIGDHAFSGVIFRTTFSHDASLTFNSSLTQIPPSCFHEASVKSNNRVKYWDKHAFKYVHTAADFNCDLILQFPDSLQSIGDCAFHSFGQSKNHFTSDVYGGILIPNGFPRALVSIGNNSFEISGTVEIQAPQGFSHNVSLKSIGSHAFNNAHLKITGEEPHTLYIVFPDSLTALGEKAFNIQNTQETDHIFVLPAGLVRIGADTFNKRYATLEVQSGTYSEQWAIENAYRYTTNEEDDLSWLYN